MTDTAFIGATSPLGKIWTSKRYFDYLVDQNEIHLLQGHAYAVLVIIDPVFWTGPYAEGQDDNAKDGYAFHFKRQLSDIKAERIIYITSADIIPEDGDELSPLRDPAGNPGINRQRDLYNFINKQFGRVLNVFIPELAISDPAFGVLGLLTPPADKKASLPVALLEQHQLYPIDRLVDDVERAIPLGIENVILATPPVTTCELVEQLYPELADNLPDARTSDPRGSTRTSIHSFHWHDPKDGYITTKEDLLNTLGAMLDH
ncbi:hypothetical protein [Akkermansia glycaniphila]|uniref:Uncharacterized protein n=1 Tax=Akkermansia glycaniphila TaxID=1679444 RepID=A0A1C7PHF2_9BACT|nr:hypothetical protein [Akkermansia glycaniphila]OCA03502.1 hypothetical protein AC781_04390 [Akkermansia glycaniphila]SEH83606.1 Hypothetical protein PYTT_1104 [Akkermansia glycaniphila]